MNWRWKTTQLEISFSKIGLFSFKEDFCMFFSEFFKFFSGGFFDFGFGIEMVGAVGIGRFWRSSAWGDLFYDFFVVLACFG